MKKNQRNEAFLIMRTVREWMAHVGVVKYESMPQGQIESLRWLLGELGFNGTESDLVEIALRGIFQPLVEGLGGSISFADGLIPGMRSVEVSLPSSLASHPYDKIELQTTTLGGMIDAQDFIVNWMYLNLMDFPGDKAAAVKAEFEWQAYCDLYNNQLQRIRNGESETKIICLGTYFAAFSLREFRYLKWFELSSKGVREAHIYLEDKTGTPEA